MQLQFGGYILSDFYHHDPSDMITVREDGIVVKKKDESQHEHYDAWVDNRLF